MMIFTTYYISFELLKIQMWVLTLIGLQLAFEESYYPWIPILPLLQYAKISKEIVMPVHNLRDGPITFVTSRFFLVAKSRVLYKLNRKNFNFGKVSDLIDDLLLLVK